MLQCDATSRRDELALETFELAVTRYGSSASYEALRFNSKRARAATAVADQLGERYGSPPLTDRKCADGVTRGKDRSPAGSSTWQMTQRRWRRSGPKGNEVDVDVPDPEQLKDIKVGDDVQVT
jgi:hypothetical protein